MNTLLKEIEICRNKLRVNRKKFWEENKKQLENNLKKIIKQLTFQKKWKIYITIGNFLTLANKKIMPYDYDSWCSANLISASKKQGFEIMIFLNKAKLEFLSLPALIPIIIHELYHVKQALKSPKKYLESIINDKISREIELEAEKEVKKLPDEFRKQEVLENILYCYDLGGFKYAKKMADHLYKKMKEMYGGGYLNSMTKKEYQIFLQAMKKKNINEFLNLF